MKNNITLTLRVPESTAMEILARLLAEGKITKKQYLRKTEKIKGV